MFGSSPFDFSRPQMGDYSAQLPSMTPQGMFGAPMPDLSARAQAIGFAPDIKKKPGFNDEGGLGGKLGHFGALLMASTGNPGGIKALDAYSAQDAAEAELKQKMALLQLQQQAKGNEIQYSGGHYWRQGPNGPVILGDGAETRPEIARKVDYYTSIGRPDLASMAQTNDADPAHPVSGVFNGQSYAGLMRGSQLPGGGMPGMASGSGGHLDAQPTVEEGWAYSPGPGGRANGSNWKPAGGPTRQGSGTFPGPAGIPRR